MRLPAVCPIRHTDQHQQPSGHPASAAECSNTSAGRMVAWVLLVLVLAARGGGQVDQVDQVARVTLLQQQVCSQETSMGPGEG